MNWAATVWMVAMVGLLIAEGVCPFHLVTIWFAVGALIAGIAALLGAQIWLQAVLFLVVSCGLLAATLPLVKKFLTPKITKTNVDAIIGTQGHITQAVDNIDATGQVKLGGMYWTARSADGQPIPEGTLVQVERIEGVKVFVLPVKVEEKV